MRSATAVSSGVQGQRDLDHKAAERARACRERAAVAFHDCTRDGETQPGAAAGAAARAFHAEKTIGEALEVGLGDAGRAVFPFDDRTARGSAKRYCDAARRIRITQAVLKQVGEN